jgi:hypothetical protein
VNPLNRKKKKDQPSNRGVAGRRPLNRDDYPVPQPTDSTAAAHDHIMRPLPNGLGERCVFPGCGHSTIY